MTHYDLRRDHLNKEVFEFRGVTIWCNPDLKIYEAYGDVLCGWWYRIRESEEKWILEAWRYGEEIPSLIMTETRILRGATFEELIAAVAVLVHERTTPLVLCENPEEKERLKHRWQTWMHQS